jgi:hypothetical protein
MRYDQRPTRPSPEEIALADWQKAFEAKFGTLPKAAKSFWKPFCTERGLQKINRATMGAASVNSILKELQLQLTIERMNRRFSFEVGRIISDAKAAARACRSSRRGGWGYELSLATK